MRALAISKRSIDAIRRANTLLDDAKVTEAVLDILVPFLERGGRAALWSGGNLGIPDTKDNGLVCIAAIYFVHCNKNGVIGF